MARADAPSFLVVNCWRGPGALIIALGHLVMSTDALPATAIAPFTPIVDLFFVMSGVLIASAYLQDLHEPAAALPYLIRRFGRIWPVHAATLAILIAYEGAKFVLERGIGFHFNSPAFNPNGTNIIQAIPTNLLLIHSLGLHDRETWNFPSWSISVEFATYGLFALVCLIAPWPRRIVSALLIVGSLLILVCFAPYHMRSTFDFGICRSLAGFFCGVLCFELVRYVRSRHWPFPTLLELSAVALTLVWMWFATATAAAYLAPLIFTLFVIAFLSEAGWLSRILVIKPLQYLAELSFTIYMIHAIILNFFMAFCHQLERVCHVRLFVMAGSVTGHYPGTAALPQVLHIGNPLLFSLIATAYLICVVGAAYVLYRLVEVPGRSAFNALAKRCKEAFAKPAFGSIVPIVEDRS
jgi:peptidoglycan/LPS O-acetylase OafA/YrhL